jgi:hypothetical protein
VNAHRSVLRLAVGLVSIVALAGCGSTKSATRPTNQPAATLETAGPDPSKTAKMICAHETRTELAGVLAANPTKVTTPTWVDHLYSCNYLYPRGTLTLSVKELTDPATATTYYESLATQLGRSPNAIALGQGAYLTTNGSVVVRKDYKVLTVDVSQLPTQFGKLGLSRSDIAQNIAATILGCWTGA